MQISLKTSVLAIGIVIGGLHAAHAQDESKRYKVGDIKMGDRVEVPFANHWEPCTVIGVRPLPAPLDTSKVDAYQLRCDKIFHSSAIADSDHVRPASGGAAAPSWNVVDASKVGPKGANKYGARNPHICDGIKGGSISAALATQAFICGAEGVRGNELYLIENVRLQLGGPAPYDPRTQTGFTAMDTRAPIYAIRGSFSQYQCTEQDANPQSRGYNYDRNCSRYDNPHASGYCWKTTFGDWRCTMNDVMKGQNEIHARLAPPR